MSTDNRFSRLISVLVSTRVASRWAAGGTGTVITLTSLFLRLNGLSESRMFSAMLAAALALADFGLGVLVLELCIWLFKKSSPAQVKLRPATPSKGAVASPPYRERRSELEVRHLAPAEPKARPARAKLSYLWPTVAIGSLIVGGLAFGMILVFAGFKNVNHAVPIEKEEVKRVTDQLNQKLTYLTVEEIGKNGLALINDDGTKGDEPLAQYVVSIQDKYVGQVSVFRAKEYVMAGSDPLKLDPYLRDLCGTIDRTLEQQDTILKALQDSDIRAQLSFSFWGVNAGIEFGPPKVVLVELAAILRRMAGLKAKKVEILIRGYADGQRGPWTAQLLPEPYNYKIVNAYLPVETNRLNSFKYVKAEVSLPIKESYSNAELPELRARFVKEEFIDRFLQDCKNTTEVEVHILKGYADYSNVIHEPDRKTEIFINVY